MLGLIVFVAAFCALVATRPTDFRVSRSATMPVAPDTVFAHINDLKKWQEWSPWAKLDPSCKTVFEGPVAGVGAKFSWAGNNDVGEGSMAIIESRAPESVRFKLVWLKPMEGESEAVFTFKPEGGATHVTWTMTGKNGFVGKAVSLFMDCDKMVGGQFEQGLSNLKGIVASAKPPTNEATKQTTP